MVQQLIPVFRFKNPQQMYYVSLRKVRDLPNVFLILDLLLEN